MDKVLEKAQFTKHLNEDYLYEMLLKHSSGEMQKNVKYATTHLPQWVNFFKLPIPSGDKDKKQHTAEGAVNWYHLF